MMVFRREKRKKGRTTEAPRHGYNMADAFDYEDRRRFHSSKEGREAQSRKQASFQGSKAPVTLPALSCLADDPPE